MRRASPRATVRARRRARAIVRRLRVLTWQPLRAARALAFVALVVGVALVDARNAEEGRDTLDAGGAVNGTTLGKEEIERAAIGGAAGVGTQFADGARGRLAAFLGGTEPKRTPQRAITTSTKSGNDQISSAWVRPGYRLILWQHGADNGEPLTMYGGYTRFTRARIHGGSSELGRSVSRGALHTVPPRQGLRTMGGLLAS